MGKKAILCVDDEAIIVKSLEMELRTNLGDECIYESAQNADDALRTITRLAQEGFTQITVITDWHMPGFGGDDFLAILRDRYPFVKTIIITGQADNTFIENIQKNRIASSVLIKPWTTRQLLQAVESGSDK